MLLGCEVRISGSRLVGIDYRGTSLIRTGSHKNEAFFERFSFLFLRTCHRPFLVNVPNFKNVPPTIFPAFLKSKKIGPRIELAHFRAENGANISLEKWGSRVEEPSKIHLQEYLVYQKMYFKKTDQKTYLKTTDQS